MASTTVLDRNVLDTLRETRSIAATARRLARPVLEIQRVAMMAYGLGALDVDLVDY